MFYISTSDFFLWHGLQCLLEPYETCWLNSGSNTEFILNSINSRDVFIIDVSIDPAPFLSYTMEKKVYPKFIFLKNFDDNTLNILFSVNNSLSLQRSLSYFRYFIFSKADKRYNDSYPFIPLSPRESTIMNLSMNGLNAGTIAVILGITTKTVYALRTRACRKFGANNVNELIPYKALVQLRTSEKQRRYVRESEPVL